MLSEVILTQLKRWLKTAHYRDERSFHFALLYRQYEGLENAMARSKSKKPDASTKSSGKTSRETKWANCKLSELDAPAILEAAEDIPALCDVLAGHFAIGGEFSIRYNADKGNYSAFVILPGNDDGSVAIGISAYAGTVPLALSSVLYKLDLYNAGSDRISEAQQSLGFG